MNRHMGFSLADMTGINIDFAQALKGAAGTGLDQLKVNVIKDAAQNPDVQTAFKEAGIQASVQSTAEALVRYKLPILIGAAAVVALMIVSRKK